VDNVESVDRFVLETKILEGSNPFSSTEINMLGWIMGNGRPTSLRTNDP